jgi:predicted nucleic acid-binding protein
MLAHPPPAHIYLDTSLVIAAMITGAPHCTASAAFCARLAQYNSSVYFSQVLRLELASGLRRLATTQTNLPAAVRQRYQLDDWGRDSQVRQRWLAFGMREFEVFLGQFEEVLEVPLSLGACQRSVAIMARDGLNAFDALHVATADELGLQAFAAADDDFKRCGHLRFQLIRDPAPGCQLLRRGRHRQLLPTWSGGTDRLSGAAARRTAHRPKLGAHPEGFEAPTPGSELYRWCREHETEKMLAIPRFQ